MKFIKYTLFILSIVALAACSRYAPIHNVNKAAIGMHNGQPLTTTQVRQAITAAGNSLGWMMDNPRPGYITGSLYLRGHMAKVGIPYTAHTYSIHYVSSEKLRKGEEIHKNYNGWIENLNRAIQIRLHNS